MIAVTGATGHLGNNLVRLLTSRGQRVRCLVLPGESLLPLEGLDVEIVRGDVRDSQSLDGAFEGADTVYHLASVISLFPGRSRLLEEVNVNGARNVADSCLRCGVRRLVHTSSVHAFTEPPAGTAIDESMPCDPAPMRMEYSKTKARGTLEVMEVIERGGLDAVLVFPTGVLGPFDFKPSEMGQMIQDFVRGRIPAVVDGGYDFVDVRDVAEGLILAAEKGKTGQKYILSGEWISVRDLLFEVSQATGRRAPRLRIPVALAQAVGSVMTLYGMATRKMPVVNKNSLDTLRGNSLICGDKARRELGFNPRPIRQSIRETVGWFKDSGRLPWLSPGPAHNV